MGASHDEFTKYPRTPHLFGSRGTSDDRHLDERASRALLSDDSLIVEEKIDGTNVGIHFVDAELVLQCRGHLITEGMHPQYDLFKQWATVKQQTLYRQLGSRFILFGEWVYARHSIHYRKLPHYFFEFDIYDKHDNVFLDLKQRLQLLKGTGVVTVPVVHTGCLTSEQLPSLIARSAYDSVFENPVTNGSDALMEGVYLRTESQGRVTARAKFVRPEFTERVKLSTHWQQQPLVPNQLDSEVDIWS